MGAVKKILISFIIIYIILYFVSTLTGLVDYSQLVGGRGPVASRLVSVSEDGGSRTYYGFAYAVATHAKLYKYRSSGVMIQEYGAALYYRWDYVFPAFGGVRRNLDFMVRIRGEDQVQNPTNHSDMIQNRTGQPRHSEEVNPVRQP